ncbi:MAG: asparagine synthase-related protein [Candidatus Binataceae bacterium]
MSAIFGILRFDGGDVSARDLERMSNVLTHRGPDGRKFILAGPAGLGHCLMRVNQEDLFERQPLIDREANLTLVADCRLDNRQELAAIFGIGAAELRDMPDSAFILRAYKQWGENCAEHLIGDFAFAVWDGGAKKLVLGRDHMGQRSVFYHHGENFFAFASEIKGLWALADVPRKLGEEALARRYFRIFYCEPDGGTIYHDIFGVAGGTILTVRRNGAVERRRYWQPLPNPVHENRDEDYYIEQYRSILAEAVACRLRRLTGPAALMNSAGFDTAAIAGLAGPVVTAQGRKLISLSWFPSKPIPDRDGDMRPWLQACRRVMPHLDIREISKPPENPLVGVEQWFLTNDETAGIDHKTLSYLYAEARAAGARLIMDGYGGDYTVNPRGVGALARHLRKGQLRRFIAELRPHLRATGQSPWALVKNEIVLAMLPQSIVRWQRELRQVSARARVNAAARNMAGPFLSRLRRRRGAADNRKIESIPRTAMRAHLQFVANEICRSAYAGFGIAAAGHGLDLTRPFHDKRVVEFGLAIPEDLYVKHGLNRHIARRALADVYPPEFQNRGRKNEGVLSDQVAILEAASSDLAAEAERLADSVNLADYFDFQRVRGALLAPKAGDDASDLARKSTALRALLFARFIAWFEGTNAQ